jgi:hypothetical protein
MPVWGWAGVPAHGQKEYMTKALSLFLKDEVEIEWPDLTKSTKPQMKEIALRPYDKNLLKKIKDHKMMVYQYISGFEMPWYGTWKEILGHMLLLVSDKLNSRVSEGMPPRTITHPNSARAKLSQILVRFVSDKLKYHAVFNKHAVTLTSLSFAYDESGRAAAVDQIMEFVRTNKDLILAKLSTLQELELAETVGDGKRRFACLLPLFLRSDLAALLHFAKEQAGDHVPGDGTPFPKHVMSSHIHMITKEGELGEWLTGNPNDVKINQIDVEMPTLGVRVEVDLGTNASSV